MQAFTTAGVLRASAGELYGPRGITVAPDGRVWVTDVGNHRVASFDALLQDRRNVGHKGTELGEFTNPTGIAAAPSGEIYVADTGNKRIQVLAPDGTPRGAFPFPGWGENVEPHLVVDSDGTLWATDPGTNSVVSLDASGRFLRRLAADDAGQNFSNPTGIAIDRKTRILYVVNSGNASVSRVSLTDRRTP
ncbi:MAG TPA: NHL repeat-containing protein [Thermoanaerobaculia bacterium]|nr:NHL repeat-containing protein [Thermoanaerobaculia bacterium]